MFGLQYDYCPNRQKEKCESMNYLALLNFFKFIFLKGKFKKIFSTE